MGWWQRQRETYSGEKSNSSVKQSGGCWVLKMTQTHVSLYQIKVDFYLQHTRDGKTMQAEMNFCKILVVKCKETRSVDVENMGSEEESGLTLCLT